MADFNLIDGKWKCNRCGSYNITVLNVIKEAPMTQLRCENCGFVGATTAIKED